MEFGINSFVAVLDQVITPEVGASVLQNTIKRIVHAEQAGLDSYGIGEHYRREFLDSAPAVILSAAAAVTSKIRLTSAVSVLSTADPVRLFQQFATLDLLSKGRAEIVAGRGSSVDSFPLFGFSVQAYEALFAEKLELLLKLRREERVTWTGRFRSSLMGLSIYPRPFQAQLPVWLGVGGTPESFMRAGSLGLPLMISVIGGEVRRFRGLVDLYRQAGAEAGFKEQDLRIGLHVRGYIAPSREKAIEDFLPGYIANGTRMAKERGLPAPTRHSLEELANRNGAFVLGEPQECVDKILRLSHDLGGISRLSLQMDMANLSENNILRSIELMGTRMRPALQSS